MAGYRTRTAAELIRELQDKCRETIKEAQAAADKYTRGWVLVGFRTSSLSGLQHKYVLGGDRQGISQTPLYVYGYLQPRIFITAATAWEQVDGFSFRNGDGQLEMAAIPAGTYFADVAREKTELLETLGGALQTTAGC